VDVAALLPSTVELTPVELEQLVHERVRQFMKLLPEVLNTASPESVHDLRVWSRRLQQSLRIMLARGTEDERATAVIRSIRQARRALSGWRDCDVLIALIDRLLGRLHNPDELRAWRMVRDHVVIKRPKEMSRAQRRLAKRRLFTLAQRVDHLLRDRQSVVAADANAPNADPIAIVATFINAAASGWQATLARAAESDDLAVAHELRIKTKKLRYWVELARDLGDKEVLTPLNRLKWLQDRLGEWHDRAELARIATEAAAGSDFLIIAPRPASLLLRRLARQLAFGAAKVRSLIAVVNASGEISQLDAWVATHGAGVVSVENIAAPHT
jgi:CHAD domain-containing protein